MTTHLIRRLGAVAVLAGTLAGCGLTPTDHHVLYVAGGPADRPASVSPAEAAQQISAYRVASGLGPVTANPQLNAIAQDYASRLARAGVVEHDVGGSLTGRMSAGGYAWSAVGENLAGGHRDLAQVLDHWQVSPGHNANLLHPDVTEIGIATAWNADTTLHTFWVLVLATP